ncbi:killer suppression protein HigA [Anabaena sp. UHCC 0451]|uniref:type II toxin-antitoxin system RelE/ParE family toxin n=1 Tax=Anabaena sp. UHCC 0451 TaxID=2055235 RepID=UPI002B21580A|nr:killer suppression protein HigA [Anabaena sp. UHCC 0451]MEA5575008.1 killer suppression protein HigA [Anabaena sp. UHCC 0451]
MEISFKNNKVQKLCERDTEAQRKLGADNAKKLKARMRELVTVENVTSLTAGKPHRLERDRLGQYAVYLAGGMRLVFEPDNYPVPLKDDGSIDWSQVTKICILEIVDYHP